jgi:LPS export ABC transporter protein LptC
MLFSCENSIKEIQEITQQDSLPIVSANNIVYERTDSGYLQVILRSPLMNRFEGNNGYSEFPDGFEVTFYDTNGTAISFIKANYGINFEKKKLMRARNNVVVKNFETEEQLNTENLIWDQRKKQIVANTFIKITAPDRIIYGDSLRAHESFSSREIFNMKGVFEVEDDTISNN